MANYGTLQTLDTLASTFQSVADFGEDRAYAQIEALLAAHNRIWATIVADMVEVTTDKQRRYGTTDSMTMTKTDEYGRPDPQKAAPGAIAGFPLDSWQIDIQWTRKYFQTASVSEFVGQATSAMDGDVQMLISRVKYALYNPTNYTFNDYLVNRLSQIPLQVRAFLNADGLGIPAGPNGEVFDGTTHTHYLAVGVANAPVAGDYIAALETVLEHYNTGEAVIAIARGQETVMRTLTPNFVAVLPQRIVGATTANQFEGPGNLDYVSINNRKIGEFNGADVWVKPWVITGYPVVYIKGQPKPLVMRTRLATSGELVLVADDERYPLRARCWEREYGIAPWNRTACAILDTTHTSYTAPTSLIP